MSGRVFTRDAFAGVASAAQSAGSATHAGEERKRKGLGIDPLVDPSAYGVIRRSISWLEPEDDHFILERGIAMLLESRLDTTGSMGDNVEIAMRVLPQTYDLLKTAAPAVLGRYDLQMITAIFGDLQDENVLFRSQAEMDVRIAEQMTLMVPEGGGYGNGHENPEYGIFGGALLTSAQINQYGLKYYDFSLSDEPLVHRIDPSQLVRVFGKEVFERLAENGHDIKKSNLPSTKEVVEELLKRAHAFFLQVGDREDTFDSWVECFGRNRIVKMPRVEYLPQVQAAIIGITEGILDLGSVEDYLRGSEVKKDDARVIARSIAGIPIGAQAILPNFNKIPLKGAILAKKSDIWPIEDESKKTKKNKSEAKKPWL